MSSIVNVDSRNKLAPAHEPYWARLTEGCYLGFRRLTAASPGTWHARYRDPDDGRQKKRSLGEFEDMPAHRRYDAAKAAAEAWFAHLGKGGTTEDVTVKAACASYVQQLRDSGRAAAADEAAARFKRWVDDAPLGKIDLRSLRASHIAAWRKSLTSTLAIPQDKSAKASRPRAAGTVNRDMTTLRAALNLALENRDVTTDDAWSAKLKPIKNADGRRDVYLDASQRKALVSKAAPDLVNLLRGLCLVPLRPGAMASLVARNFDKRLSTLTIGKDKQGQDRKITLPASTAAFFASQAADKLPAAPLLSRANGAAWDKDSWKYPFKDAVAAAALPSSATAYALRHSVITDLIALHRLDTLTVAQLSGTSLQMIEKHYGHLLRDHAATALAALTV